MKTFTIVLSIVASIAVVAGQSYCEKSCTDWRTNRNIKHIGCQHSGQFDKNNCPKNAKLVPINDSLQKLLIDAHNEKRNFIAGGGDPNHKKACNMATMQWDKELAYLASLNVMQCIMEHDQCHNTKAFQHSGQNLHYYGRSPVSVPNAEQNLKKVVQDWFNEVENSTQSVIDYFPPDIKAKIGHFTVMMADRNTHLGCSAATYDKNGLTYFLTACNYATTNMQKHSIYKKCNKAGEQCKHGKNPKYPNLCSVKEQYDVNNWK